MGDSGYTGLGRAAIVASVLQGALVLLWVVSLATNVGPSSPHFPFYVVLPLAFLALPVLVIIVSRYLLARSMSERGCLIAWGLWALLGINFILFACYAIISGAWF